MKTYAITNDARALIMKIEDDKMHIQIKDETGLKMICLDRNDVIFLLAALDNITEYIHDEPSQ